MSAPNVHELNHGNAGADCSAAGLNLGRRRSVSGDPTLGRHSHSGELNLGRRMSIPGELSWCDKISEGGSSPTSLRSKVPAGLAWRSKAAQSSADGSFRSKVSRCTVDELRRHANHAGADLDATSLGSNEVPFDEVKWDEHVMETLSSIKMQQSSEQMRQAGGSGRGRRSISSAAVTPAELFQMRRTSVTLRSSSSVSDACSMSGIDRSLSGPSDGDRAHLTRPRRLILAADSRVRAAWDLAVTLVLAFAYVAEPAQGGFSSPPPEGAAVPWPSHLVVDALLLLDVIVRLRTAYNDDGLDAVVTAPRHIAAHYARGSLAPDVLACLPLELALPRSSGWRPFVVLAKALPRLPPLLRRLRVGVDSLVNPLALQLAKLCCVIFLIWHWAACIYFRLYRDAASGSGGSADHGWFTDGDEGWGPLLLLEAPASAQYAFSLHWAIAASSQTMHPTPDTLAQQAFAVFVSLVGVVVVAVSVGAATTILAELHAQTSGVTNKLTRIHLCLRDKAVSAPLRRRVLAYYAFRFGAMQNLDTEVLEGLPGSLKLQLTLVMHAPLFVKLPLFWLCSSAETLALAQRLQPALALPGEALIKAGEKGLGLYLLMKGAVQFVRDGVQLRTLYAVSAFGEAALLDTPSTMPAFSVVALRYCEVSVLLRKDFFHILRSNPDLTRHLQAYAAQRDAPPPRPSQGQEPAAWRRLLRRSFGSSPAPGTSTRLASVPEVGRSMDADAAAEAAKYRRRGSNLQDNGRPVGVSTPPMLRAKAAEAASRLVQSRPADRSRTSA